MNFRQKHRRLVCLLLALIMTLALCGTSVEAADKWTLEDNNRSITNGKDTYYIKIDTLYKKTSSGKEQKITQWNLSGHQTLTMEHVYKNKIYVWLTTYADVSTIASGILYSVDSRTGKKTKAVTNCLPLSAYGQYLYAYSTKEIASGPRTAYIWKVSGNKMKNIGKLGDKIFVRNGPIVYRGKLYYASYEGIGMNNMTVYRSNLDGTRPKKLFNLDSNGEYAQIVLSGVHAKTIDVDVFTTSGWMYYEYNLKTGKVTTRAR